MSKYCFLLFLAFAFVSEAIQEPPALDLVLAGGRVMACAIVKLKSHRIAAMRICSLRPSATEILHDRRFTKWVAPGWEGGFGAGNSSLPKNEGLRATLDVAKIN